MNRLLAGTAAAVLGLCLGTAAAHAAPTDPDTLRVALLPDESPATIIQNNKGLEQYLEAALGKEVELVVTTDYSSMIEAMRFKRLELAYFGPLSYVLAKSRSEIEPFAAMASNGVASYTGVIIANAEAGIDDLRDIEGKTVGFGDPASTSSHLVPRALLKENGLEGGADYEFHHLGAHDAVARAVEAGNVQAGGLSRPIFESLIERKVIDPAKVKVIGETGAIPNYPWTMRSDLSPDLKERIREAFLGLDDAAVLKAFKADGFLPITDADYDVLRDTARLLELDLAGTGG
ncbi:phosphate/phosphite/phosphonate ABC transporter substrate-binding protein [Arenibaculum sp.]|jgi:phosphonate transport system substrate-binding protein|uniref:phosphate/phosphite/phosphonate ABC transporter substrate-binding protein n=1 Tax=Arenibaculum sp. TaxID=2865862 RepID=UPI002E16384F|nr:phosphate/phosphite/phosphonate ABC transporter substrate-binding protein [Arenibaculum sp.]